MQVDRALVTMASVLYDAVVVGGGRDSVEALRGNGTAVRYVAEAYKHAKPIAAIGEGVELLRGAPLNDARISDDGLVDNSGVVTLAAASNGDLAGFIAALTTAIAQHRHFDRRVDPVPA